MSCDPQNCNANKSGFWWPIHRVPNWVFWCSFWRPTKCNNCFVSLESKPINHDWITNRGQRRSLQKVIPSLFHNIGAQSAVFEFEYLIKRIEIRCLIFIPSMNWKQRQLLRKTFPTWRSGVDHDFLGHLRHLRLFARVTQILEHPLTFWYKVWIWILRWCSQQCQVL